METAIEPMDCPHITFRAYPTLNGPQVESICELSQTPCKPEDCVIFDKYKEEKDVETK